MRELDLELLAARCIGAVELDARGEAEAEHAPHVGGDANACGIIANDVELVRTCVRDDARPRRDRAARVRRVLAFGVAARVELEGADAASGQPFEVELTRERARELGLREGEVVRLVPSRLKVFESDRAESTR